jgi:hypothetical protein
MSRISLHDPFGHLKHKLWPKERPGVNLAIWHPTSKSQESTRFPYAQVECHISLERSQWGLQLCFGPHLNWRFTHKVTELQSCRSPNFGNFWTPIWESRDKMPFRSPKTKCHLDVGLVERHRVYYKVGRWRFPPSPGHDESYESEFAHGIF